MLTIGEQQLQTERIYCVGNIQEKPKELNIESTDIQELVLWGRGGAIDVLMTDNKGYGIVLENEKELKNLVNFILNNSDDLKNVEIKDREKILKY